VVGAEVGEGGSFVVQEVPDDDENGSSDSDDGFLPAATSGDPAVTLAEEGIGACGADGGFTEDPGQIGIAVPGRTVALVTAG
jgi:hypothetical protein